MLLVFFILIIVTICVTIVGTYFLLNAENYHWQWTAFASAASTAIYVFLYAVYYYYVKTKMTGFFQTSFYFGYTLMFCAGLGITCGELHQRCLLHVYYVVKDCTCFSTSALSGNNFLYVPPFFHQSLIHISPLCFPLHPLSFSTVHFISQGPSVTLDLPHSSAASMAMSSVIEHRNTFPECMFMCGLRNRNSMWLDGV